MRSLSFLSVGLVLLACGGTSTPDILEGGTGGDGSTTTGDSSASDGSSLDGGMCMQGTFMTFEKGCTGTDNCSFGLHQIDCCGNATAIGFNHSQKTAFDAAEMVWRTGCPGCGCPAGPAKTESGMMCDPGKVIVKCVTSGMGGSGKCTTSCP